MEDEAILSHLRKTLKLQNKINKHTKLIKPLYSVKTFNIKYGDATVINKAVIKKKSKNDIIESLIQEIEYLTCKTKGTNDQVNQLLCKLIAMKDIPECQPIIDEFLKENTEYVSVIYPELKEHN